MIDDERLLREWDWEKNAKEGFFPERMAPHSNINVHWKCALGHEWMYTIDKRTSGQNCPFCSNRRLLVGFNDLASKYPEVAKEWDFEGNGSLLPSEVVFGCAKSVWWKCSVCGNRWQTKVRDRTKRKTGCPKCAIAKIQQKRYNTFLKNRGAICDSLLLSEWNYERNGTILPENITAGSGKIVWWKCSKCGSEWQAKISNRMHGRGCPFCSNKRIRVGFNDLYTTHPQLAAEWDYEKNGDLTPQMLTYGRGKKIWWKCPLGHSYQATLSHRTQGTNCPICNSGRQTSFAEQAIYYYIKRIYPDAINRYTEIFDNGMELDIFIPFLHVGIEYDGVFWHKEKLEREHKKYLICRQNKIRLIRIREAPLTAESDLGLPVIADNMYHMDNLDDQKNLEKFIIRFLRELESWRRKKKQGYLDINLERDGNEIRRQYLVSKREGALDKTHPKLAEEWDYEKNDELVPSMFQSGSDLRVWWKCSVCGHEWKTNIYHRASGGGCPKCYRKNNRGKGHSESKCIYQYSKNGEFVKKWDCISEAGRELQLNSSNITSCAKHLRAYAGGFRWEYTYLTHLVPIVRKQPDRKGKNGKKILQFDKDGNFIKEFSSVSEAAAEAKIDASTISKMLHGHTMTAGGFVWKPKSPN